MQPRSVDRILVAWAAAGTLLLVTATLIAPIILVGSLVAPLLLCDRAALRKQLADVSPVTLLLLLAGVYLAINASWSLDRGSAYMAVATIFALAVVSHVGTSALAAMRPEHVAALSRGLVIGFFLGGAFLAFEFATHLALHRMLEKVLHSVGLTGFKIRIETTGKAHLFVLNRNLVAFVMLLWAACLIQMRSMPAKTWLAYGPPIALAAAAALFSSSATARVGLVAGSGVLVLALLLPRLALYAVAAVWTVLCLGALPIAHLLYKHEAYNAMWLFVSARHRIMIWGATSSWYWKAPWFGAGAASARNMAPTDPAHAAASPDLVGAALNWHSHNAYLQVWFEAGALGAAILFAVGIALWLRIARADPADRPLLCAAFASVSIMAATAFSIWAAWYLSAIGLAALYAVMAMMTDQRPKVA